MKFCSEHLINKYFDKKCMRREHSPLPKYYHFQSKILIISIRLKKFLLTKQAGHLFRLVNEDKHFPINNVLMSINLSSPVSRPGWLGWSTLGNYAIHISLQLPWHNARIIHWVGLQSIITFNLWFLQICTRIYVCPLGAILFQHRILILHQIMVFGFVSHLTLNGS